MVGQNNYFLFTPLLHEVATGGINPENIIEPIRKVLGCCLKNFHLGKAEFVNLKNRTVKVADAEIPYDYLVLAPGAETNFYDVPGASEHSLSLKSIDDAIKIKNRSIAQIELASNTEDREERKKILRFVIVGGGPTGVELAAELQELIEESFSHYYKKNIIEDASVILIQKDRELLPQFGEKVRKKSLEVLVKKGIKVMLQREVKEVSDTYVLLDNNETIPTKTVIWVAGIKPANLNFDEPVERSNNQKLVVNKYLQIKGHREVFVIGDAAAVRVEDGDGYVPALAQAAEKEARAVAKNIKLLVDGKEPKPFYYHHSGDLLSLGRWMAIGEIGGFTFSGGFTWWIWRTVYLSKLISFRKKVRVAIDWTMDIFSPRDISDIGDASDIRDRS